MSIESERSDLIRDLREAVEGLRAESTRLRGALAATDERILRAGQRVGLVFGSDTPEHLADEILALRTENERLRAAEHPCGRGCQCDPPGSGEEIAALRETNRRLNRRIGELEHALAKTESRRLDWERERKENEALRALPDRLDRVALWFGHDTPEKMGEEIATLRARATRAEDRLAELEPLARACAEAVEKHDSARIAHEAAIAAASFDGILFPFLLKREAVVAYKAALAAAVRIRELLALPEGEPNV